MWYMTGQAPEPRERLLAAAIEHMAHHGISDLSLRQLAAALGTSHRMLVYHFGSKEGLLVEVVRAVEAQQREALAQLAADAHLPPDEQARRFWQRLADPALWPYERLFFEVYGQALQGRPHTVALLDGIVDTWLEPLSRITAERGIPERQARAVARLGIAVSRGLLLDLLATGDRDGTDDAMELFIQMYERLALLDPGDEFGAERR
jgi:AcrR family transcriptional regulator